MHPSSHPDTRHFSSSLYALRKPPYISDVTLASEARLSLAASMGALGIYCSGNQSCIHRCHYSTWPSRLHMDSDLLNHDQHLLNHAAEVLCQPQPSAAPHYSSEKMSPSKSLCGPFKRNCLSLPQFQSPLAFTARNYGDLSSWHWNPGLGYLEWGWDPLLLRYPS